MHSPPVDHVVAHVRDAFAADGRVSELGLDVTHEGDDLVGANMVVMNLKRRADAATCGRESHCADDAQAIVAVPCSLDRRLAAGSPGAAVYRLEPEACFIDKNNAGSKSPGFFLMRGQSSFRHRSTARRSCSRATSRGFWGLNPKSCKIRPTWSGWYRTPNRFRTTAATRAQVHKSVPNPQARGPESSSLINCNFCFSESLVARGGCGLAANAFTPPVCQATFQRFTLDRLTPIIRAIFRRGLRSWKYSAARRRRASSSAALPFGLIHVHTMLAQYRVRFTRRDH